MSSHHLRLNASSLSQIGDQVATTVSASGSRTKSSDGHAVVACSSWVSWELRQRWVLPGGLTSDRASPMLATCENNSTDSTIVRPLPHPPAPNPERAWPAITPSTSTPRCTPGERKARVVDRMRPSGARSGSGRPEARSAVSFHARRQRLHPYGMRKGVERADRPSRNPCTRSDGVSERLGEAEPVVAQVGFDGHRLEVAAADQSNLRRSKPQSIPPIRVPWPPMNFVSEWTTMSPRDRQPEPGRRWGRVEIGQTGLMRPGIGDRLDIQRKRIRGCRSSPVARVFSLITAHTASRFIHRTTSMDTHLEAWWNRLAVPP